MKYLLTTLALTLSLSATAKQKLDLSMDILTSPHAGLSELNNQYKIDHVTVDGRIGFKGSPYKLTGEYHAYTADLPYVGKRTGKVLWLGAGKFWVNQKGNQYYFGGALNHKAKLMKFKAGMSVPVIPRGRIGGEVNHATYIGGRKGRPDKVFPRTELMVKGRYKLNKHVDAVGRYTTGNAGRANVMDTVQLGISLKY